MQSCARTRKSAPIIRRFRAGAAGLWLEAGSLFGGSYISELKFMVEVPNEDDFPHEHEFTADVVSWMNLIIAKDSALPFSSVKFDRRTKGLQKRRDLSLIGKDGRVLITGEIKLPYQKDGATPYNALVVCDARRKAARAGAEYFFTWNVNECVLWKTET